MTQHQKNPRGVYVALAAGALWALAALPVMAIDLGAASLKSAPNAPLEIDIAVLDVASGELESLRPQIPANSRSAELASASIELVQGEGMSPVLRLRTPQPVSADEVRFVVVADWGRGRKFREYVISLVSAPSTVTPADPPQGAPEAAAPPPAETTFSTRSEAGSVAQTATPESVAGETAAPTAGLKTTRIVRNGETLMSISREWSATTGATLAQTMLGIFQANPQAFGPRGMNELLVGSEIVLPESATLVSTSSAAASSEIGRTLGIWRTAGTPGASSGGGASGARVEDAAPPAVISVPMVAQPPAAPAAEAPLLPETPEALIARLQDELLDKTAQLAAQNTEVAALQARLEAAEAAASTTALAGRTAGGWLGEVHRWAALAWWAIPLLALTSVGLLLGLLLQRRRRSVEDFASAVADAPAVEAPAAPVPKEMTFDLPPIKASRASAGVADVLLDESASEDLEGDPPPVDEAGSKINLARAFIEMGHHDAAILELQAALRLGDETQRAEALRLLDSLPKS